MNNACQKASRIRSRSRWPRSLLIKTRQPSRLVLVSMVTVTSGTGLVTKEGGVFQLFKQGSVDFFTGRGKEWEVGEMESWRELKSWSGLWSYCPRELDKTASPTNVENPCWADLSTVKG